MGGTWTRSPASESVEPPATRVARQADPDHLTCTGMLRGPDATKPSPTSDANLPETRLALTITDDFHLRMITSSYRYLRPISYLSGSWEGYQAENAQKSSNIAAAADSLQCALIRKGGWKGCGDLRDFEKPASTDFTACQTASFETKAKARIYQIRVGCDETTDFARTQVSMHSMSFGTSICS